MSHVFINLVFILVGINLGVIGKNIPCKLEWTTILSDGSIPENAVGIQGSDYFVTRALNYTSDKYSVGWTEKVKKKGFFISSESYNQFQEYDFEILTNPRKCILKWVNWGRFSYEKDSDITVKVENKLIGRGEVQSLLLSGPVDADREEIIIPSENDTQFVNKTNFEVLTSHITGFDMKISQVVLENDPMDAAGLSFLGMDEIHNLANVNLTYAVEFSRSVYSRYFFREFHSCSSSWQASAGMTIDFFGKHTMGPSASAGIFGSSYWEKSLLIENSEQITITQSITVSPFQSVQVCSTYSQTSEQFVSNYTARITAEAKGWTGEDIASIIRNEEGWDSLEIHNSSVSKVIEGTFQGSVGLAANIQVFPIGQENRCSDIQKQEATKKKQLFRKKKAKLMERKLFHEKMRKEQMMPKFEFGSPIASAQDVHFLLFNKDANSGDGYELMINDPQNLAASKYIKNLPLVFISHGWQSNTGDPKKLKDEILKYHNYNIVLIDWSKLAGNIMYNLAAGHTRLVGRLTATLIEFLVARGMVTADKVHLIGHSLGGHIVGFAGAFLIKGKIGRITALDPALPLFRKECDANRIDPSDGKFVDVLHTAGGTLGFLESRGHADFYPNGGTPVQPGCFPEDIALTQCSHNKAWEYITRSVNSTSAELQAYECSSYTDFLNGRCSNSKTALMGLRCDTNSKGNFYLRF